MQTYTEGAAARDLLTWGPHALDGWIPIPLSIWREVSSNDIPADAANGGLLTTDSTPALQYANADTDSSLEISWASSNSDAIVMQTPLPPDFDPSNALVLHVIAYMGGATDTPVLDLDSYFNVGDTKLSDATGAVTGTAVTEYTATIAAADIPNLPWTVTIEVTPAAHTTDELVVVATWLSYTRLP